MSTNNTALPNFPFVHVENSYELPEDIRTLREEGPVRKIHLFDGTPAWIVTRHKEVCEALGSQKLSNERFSRDGYPEIHSGGKKKGEMPTFVHMEDPEHAKQRDMVEGFFTPEATEALHPRINHVVHSLLDSFREKGSNGKPVDLVQEFAALVNPHVIFLLFDVPPQEAEQLAKASAAVGGTSGTAGESSHTSLHGYISRLVDERIEHPHPPQDDLISKLVLEQYKTGNLSKDDIDRLAFMLFIAGNAAIASSIYLGVLSLLEHPDQLGALRDDPKLIKQAVEEILRYHTPSALNSRRVAREDVQLGDQCIKAGDGVICLVRSANRDPDVFPEPDLFNIYRKFDRAQNLAFGFGSHECQAQWLSRLVVEVALGSLIQALPNLRLAVSPAELEFTPPAQNVGLAHLPVYI